METISANAAPEPASTSHEYAPEPIPLESQAPSRSKTDSSRPPAVLIYSPQFNTIGGIETHLVRLSTFLAERGWRVTLVTTSGMLEETRVAELAAAKVEFLAPSGAKTLSVPRKAAWLAWLAATRLRRQHWDVIYTNAQGSLSWLLRPLKRRGTRIVHHYHTAGDERDQATWSWLFVKWLSAVDEIVACSHSTAKNIRQVVDSNNASRKGSDKVRVIRCLSSDVSAMIDRPQTPLHAKLRFGFIGRLMRDKGIEMMCRLSEDPDLAHIEWHIHGSGAGYESEYFEKYPNVRYHGRYRGGAALSAILAQLDALVLFSTYQEGMPIALSEGMSAGLPWIASDQGGTREMMWSPENCRLIGGQCDFAEAKRAVLDLSQAIREGKTCNVAQRRAYDENLAAPTVGRHWMEFLA